MIQAPVLSRPLYRSDVVRAPPGPDDRGITPGIGTDVALLGLGQVEAALTRADPLLHLAQSVCQSPGIIGPSTHDVECDPLGALRSDRGELRELGYKALDRPRVARQR